MGREAAVPHLLVPTTKSMPPGSPGVGGLLATLTGELGAREHYMLVHLLLLAHGIPKPRDGSALPLSGSSGTQGP